MSSIEVSIFHQSQKSIVIKSSKDSFQNRRSIYKAMHYPVDSMHHCRLNPTRLPFQCLTRRMNSASIGMSSDLNAPSRTRVPSLHQRRSYLPLNTPEASSGHFTPGFFIFIFYSRKPCKVFGYLQYSPAVTEYTDCVTQSP